MNTNMAQVTDTPIAEKKIFFATITLNQAVHAIGLGFTTMIYKYAFAETDAIANSLATAWAVANDCDVKKVTCTLAKQQDPYAYTFPHQVINLPQTVLDAIYDKRQYPSEYRDAAQQIVTN